MKVLFALIFVWLFLSFSFFIVEAQENQKSEDWICLSIKNLVKKGLVNEELFELIQAKNKELTRIEWARILTVIVAGNEGKFSAEDLKTIDMLFNEFKYEMLLLRIQMLEKGNALKEEEENKLRLSGNIKFIPEFYHGKKMPWFKEEYGNIPSPSKGGINQKIDLYLRAKVDSNWGGFVKLYNSGYWGAGKYTPDVPETGGPFYIDEAYMEFNSALTKVKGGRIRFSLGPLGILVGNELRPIPPLEGVEIKNGYSYIKTSNIIGRITSDYYPETLVVAGQDNFYASRISIDMKNFVVGANYLWSGLSKEKGYSLDYNIRRLGLSGEYAGYKLSSDVNIEGINWSNAYVGILSFPTIIGLDFSFRYGRLSKYFFPIYSSLYYSDVGEKVDYFEEGIIGSDCKISKKFSEKVNMTLEHFGIKNRTNLEHDNISILSFGYNPINEVNFIFEYNRWAEGERLNKTKYGQFRSIISINF